MINNDSSVPDRIEVSLEASIPQRDQFARSNPAIDEGPASAWQLARTVIDFAGAVIGSGGKLRIDRQIRDAVLYALLRRATITVEACTLLLAKGLIEPALGLRRTLLDIEVNVRLIHQDPTDRMAKKLAAYHYYAYQQHGQDMLSSRETREGTLTEGGRVPEIVQVAKGYAQMLGTEVFDEVRDDVKQSRYWHGYESVQAAFEALGQASDYHMTYDMCTWFVHAVNVDHDYVSRDDPALHLKPLVERDPAVIQTLLGDTIVSFLMLLQTYALERDLSVDGAFAQQSQLTFPDGNAQDIDPLTGLMALAVAEFPSTETPKGAA